MLIQEKKIELKNHKIVTLRSATKKDAKAQCDHWTQTAKETPFLARYQDECIFNLEEIEHELETIENSPISFMINAFDGEIMVANARVVAIKELKKYEKPFLVLLNSQVPYKEETQRMAEEMEKKYAADIKVSLPRKVVRKIKRTIKKILRGGVTHKKKRTNADYGMLLTFKK